MKKMLIADLDGTLYPKKDVKNKNQLKDNIEAVKKWIDKGNKFAVATARGLHHYPELKEVLGFDVNYIGCNGAAVRIDTGETISKTIPFMIYLDICKFVVENNINASVATRYQDKWYWSSDNKYPVGANVLNPGFEDEIEVVDLNIKESTIATDRIQVFVPDEDLVSLRARLEERNYPVTITTSDTYLIDIGPKNSSKGITIMELKDRFEIDEDAIIVVGDSENDIPMFKVANRSYCIDHADKEVKDSADYIIESVAKVIETELNNN